MKIKECITGRAEMKDQLKFRNYVLAFLVLIGILFYVLMFFNVGIIGMIGEKAKYIYNGMAGAYIAVGIASIIKNNRILKNKELLKKYSVAVKDERNIAIQRVSMSISVCIYMWTALAAGLIIAPFNYTVASTLFYSICGLLIILCLVRFIINKVM